MPPPILLHLTALSAVLIVLLVMTASVMYSRKSSGSNDHIFIIPPGRWDVGELKPVRVLVEDTRQYQLDTTAGIAQWEHLVPPDGGIIHHSHKGPQYTISMFHQLRCLDVVRSAVVATNASELAKAQHCMNYLRQMVLCRVDLGLENVRDPYGPHAVELTRMHTCQDWRAVYDAVERNKATFVN
ncbi:hypothetical protein EW146_g9028 [Bondarzewia mesenterica]|uniref:Uncharacterized protein n=1 Tax=Bondarzewia mesenterica TaxID=1095465 RepID=A0A4S4LA35_9AGAM|nr:hypothetical protein EW146_g9028 [Bondarzewia mesenterica]